VHKVLVAIAFFAIFPLLLAQQTLNNDCVIKMFKMGFPDDMIVNAINRSPGTYDTAADGLIALRTLESEARQRTPISFTIGS